MKRLPKLSKTMILSINKGHQNWQTIDRNIRAAITTWFVLFGQTYKHLQKRQTVFLFFLCTCLSTEYL